MATEPQDSRQDPRRVIRKLNIAGFAIMVLMFGGLGGWAATSQLSGAVIAPGMVVVESYVKKVQHPTGGIVGAILVHEGDSVEAGQVVMRLDDTVTRSTLGVVRSQLDELLAREARLTAERDSDPAIVFPDELIAREGEKGVGTAMRGERTLFESRRNGRLGQQSQLRERVVQSNEEIRGLSAQQESKEREIKFITQELTGVSSLWDKNLVSISRLMTLQRDKARLEGERGQNIADIARARGKISETELQILQLDQDFRTDVLKDTRETQGKIAELRERVTAAEDQLKRVDIRAPQSGIVQQLNVHTVGGVIQAGEAVMLIVPESDTLVIEAKVPPQDIDQLVVGAPAAVRVQAGNQRTMPDMSGKLIQVAADLSHDPPASGQNTPPYYLVRVSLPDDQVRKLGDLHLVPGMPAEAFIQTHARTPLQYLLKPLHDQITRTFRER